MFVFRRLGSASGRSMVSAVRRRAFFEHSVDRNLLAFTAGAPNGDAPDYERQAVYVCLGWLGAKPRHFRKILRWYHDRGLDTLAVIPPVSSVYATALQDELFSQSLSEAPRPVVFHTFSGNGINFLVHLLHQAEGAHGQSLRHAVRGFIFDSGPMASISDTLLARSLTHVTLSWVLPRESRFDALTYNVPVLTSVYRMLARTLLQWRPMRQAADFLLDYTWNHLPPAPTCLLYSADDYLVPAADVERFAHARHDQGSLVMARCFDSSPHVAHFKEHRAEYIRALERFLAAALGEHDVAVPRALPAGVQWLHRPPA